MVTLEDPWANWMVEGHFYSFEHQRVRTYFYVLNRDWAHIEYTWTEDVTPAAYSGPFVPNDLETTKETQIWQLTFGLEPDVYIHVYLPTDLVRHGLPKRIQSTASLREVSHYTHKDSPFKYPSFVTEHFLIKPINPFIGFAAYNPRNITFRQASNPIKLNIYIAKCEMEIIGSEQKGELSAASERFTETLDKLYRRIIPHRPITLEPVRAPAKGV